MSKFIILIFMMTNLSVLLAISWGYIFFRVRKTIANEALIADKIRQLKNIVAKHTKDNDKEAMGKAEFKIQQECIANLQVINQHQQDAIAEVENIENDDSLDQESKERYIKVQLASLKAQSDTYEDTINILRKQINQGNSRLSFIEEKLLLQKQELLKLRVLKDNLK